MPATSGKVAVLQISTTVGGAGTYTTCLGIENPQIALDGLLLDVTELPATYVARIQGLKDARITATGTYQPLDTTGQLAIRNAWVNDSELWYLFWPLGLSGVASFKQLCKVDKWSVDSNVSGKATVSFDLAGSGTLTVT